MPGTAAVARPATAAGFAGAVALFLVAANLPYAWLVTRFGYDDILREPTPVILQAFDRGGDALVLAWLAFALGALLFIPVALGLRRLVWECGVDGAGAAILGVVSAVAQAAGLLRWVFVVPALAAAYVGAAADTAQRAAALATFEAIHRFAGMVVGEMLGQLLLAGWTVLAVRDLRQARIVPRWLLWMGAAIAPLWILGQTELLHAVVAAVPAIEVTPAAFMLWEAWLAAVAVTVVLQTRPTVAAVAHAARIGK
jgi:hypothetical protein